MALQVELRLHKKRRESLPALQSKGTAVKDLHQTVGHHGICNLDETGDIGADNIVAR